MPAVPLYAFTLFLSACLLFLIQLMVGKMLLPRFGGTPAVWNTCLLFFQAMLSLGYAYAHKLTSLASKAQIATHITVLALGVAFLPPWIASEGVTGSRLEAIAVLATLTGAVGLPVFAVSATSPLLQRWFTQVHRVATNDPYFLYAASNAGSLLALASYPVAIEPALSLRLQSYAWGSGYVMLVLAIFACATLVPPHVASAPSKDPQRLGVSHPERITPHGWPAWFVLSFIPTSLLYGVTSIVTTDVAPVPLLWAIPLVLYLVTYVLAFVQAPRVPYRVFATILPILLATMLVSAVANAAAAAWLLLVLHLGGFFVAATVLHRMLAVVRPPAQRLTRYYLVISLGGVTAGVFNVLVAPLVFDDLFEYPLALVLATLAASGPIAGPLLGRRETSIRRMSAVCLGIVLAVLTFGCRAPWDLRATMIAVLVVTISGKALTRSRVAVLLTAIVAALIVPYSSRAPGVEESERRTFFGVHRVIRDSSSGFATYLHGSTIHGMQSLDPARADQPLTYFHRTGPIGRLMREFVDARPAAHVGVLGLGVGTLAAYARADQSWVFYEIDPMVERIAHESFSYLPRCTASHRVVLGDARLSLAESPAEAFDVLVMDAFSSDAVPAHLLTIEAMRLYLSHLSNTGVLALNVTNRFLDLEPLVAAAANVLDLHGRIRRDLVLSDEQLTAGKTASRWIVLARTERHLGTLAHDDDWQPLDRDHSVAAWTDEFSNLWAVTKFTH